MTNQNKRTAIWISKESREIIEKYAKDNMLGLGEAIDSIISKRAKDEEILVEGLLVFNETSKKLIKAHRELSEVMEKPWWKIW